MIAEVGDLPEMQAARLRAAERASLAGVRAQNESIAPRASESRIPQLISSSVRSAGVLS
jgi:hypothetical protein